MAKFKDAEKRSWSLKVTVGSLKKVKEDTDIDLGFIVSGKLQKLQDILEDPFSLAAVLYSLCEDQAEEREISPDDFAGMLFGETFEKAVEALIDSIVDFYPRQKSQVLRDALAKERAKQEQDMEKALEELQD